MQRPKMPKIPKIQGQTLMKHALIHTGIYFALTGRRASSQTTKADVWRWLTQEFRASHPQQYETLLRRQQDRVDWERSNGTYTEKDQDVLNKAFVSLYANATPGQGMFTEQEVESIIDELGLKDIYPLLRKFIVQFIEKQTISGELLKETFAFLADLEDDEFDVIVNFFTDKTRTDYLTSFFQSSGSAASSAYRKFGKFSWETLQDVANLSADTGKGAFGLGKGALRYSQNFIRDGYQYFGNDVKSARQATRQRIPAKRTVVRRSRSVRKALFGRHAHVKDV